MKNRAKCRLCKSVIESFHATDYVNCSCGEIAVEAGEALKCYANDWNNFLRIDDEGNEIEIKVESASVAETPSTKTRKRELLKMLQEMTESYEKLPQQAMMTPVTNYDLWAALTLISSILACDEP